MGNGQSRNVRDAAFDIVKAKHRAAPRLRKLFEASELTREEKAQLLACKDSYGRTLLHVSCQHGNAECVQFLIEEGASVADKSVNGWTPLHYVSMLKNEDKAVEIITLLLLARADPLARNSKGHNSFHVAQFNRRLHVLRHLESRICDFAGAVKIEASSSVQVGIGAVLGDSARSRFIDEFGTKWKPRWVVVSRLRGSRMLAKVPRLQCPTCLAHQPTMDRQHAHITCTCGQVLVVPPNQRAIADTISIYSHCNSLFPDVIYNLEGSSLEVIGKKELQLTFASEILDKVDPVYQCKRSIMETMRQAKRRFAVRGRRVIRITCEDVSKLHMLRSALSRKLRSLPEPNSANNFSNNLHAIPSNPSFSNTPLRDVNEENQYILHDDSPIPLAVAVPSSYNSSRQTSYENTISRESSFSQDHSHRRESIGGTVKGHSSEGMQPHADPQLRQRMSSHSSLANSSIQQTEACADANSDGPALVHAEPNLSSSPSSSLPEPVPGPLPPRPSSYILSQEFGDKATSQTEGRVPWQCLACTFQNPAGLTNCSMCESPQGGTEATPSAPEPAPTAQNTGNLDTEPSAPSQSNIIRRESGPSSSAAQKPQSGFYGSVEEAFLCPITHKVMIDPVFTCDGLSYERKAIEKWFKDGNTTSPTTHDELDTTQVVPNVALRKAIDKFLAKERLDDDPVRN